MALLPARNILDGTALPVTSQMKTALGSLRDYCSDLLGTDSGNKAAARTALGAAASGANTDITSLGAVTGVTATPADNTTKLATTAFVMANALVPAASDTVAGKIEIATAAETQAGADNTRAVSPAGLQASAFGIGQVWQNVSGSRALSTVYTNTTGRTIQLFVVTSGSTNATSQTITVSINGLSMLLNVSYYNHGHVYHVVPAGGAYSVQVNFGSLVTWFEYR